PPRLSRLFPYTTLFRSPAEGGLLPAPAEERLRQRPAERQRFDRQRRRIAVLPGEVRLRGLDVARVEMQHVMAAPRQRPAQLHLRDRKSTRLNSSHDQIS